MPSANIWMTVRCSIISHKSHYWTFQIVCSFIFFDSKNAECNLSEILFVQYITVSIAANVLSTVCPHEYVGVPTVNSIKGGCFYAAPTMNSHIHIYSITSCIFISSSNGMNGFSATNKDYIKPFLYMFICCIMHKIIMTH